MMRLLTLLLVACGLVLPAQAQQHPTDIDFPDLPDFQIPEAQRVELDNGVVLFLIEDRTLPLINMVARVGAGDAYDPADKVGLATITSQVMRTGGTEAVSGDELNRILESNGGVIETSMGTTAGTVFMSTLTEELDTILPLYVDVMTNPAFPEDKIALAKTQLKSGISRRNDDAQQIASREFAQVLYGEDSPYARTPEYFTVDAVTRDDLVDFHDRYFVPNNVMIGVWGDFDADAMAETLADAFGAWPRDPSFEKPELPAITTSDDYGVYYAEKADVNQSTVYLGHVGEVTLDHPDYPALTVMNEVLSGFSGRLFQSVRDDQGLAYAVFGGYTANYDRPGQFFSGVMTKSETTVEAAEAIITELEKLRAEAPDADELALAKDSYLNSFVFNFDTRSEIVNRIMTYEAYGYPTDFLDQQKTSIEQVEAADVQRVAAQYVRPDDLKILTVGNDADFGEPLSTLGEVTTLDITIPTSAEAEPEATEESLSQGRALLTDAIAALGGQAAFEAIETARVTSEQSVTTPDNMQLTIGLTALIDYPDRALFEQQTPMGAVTLTMDGDAMTMVTPQGTMQAPPAVQRQIRSSLWRNLPYLVQRADEVAVQYVGTEEVDGVTAEVLRIEPPQGAPFRMYLNAETTEPMALAYQGMNMMGAPVETMDRLEDYRAVDGVRLPFRIVSTADGQPAADTKVTNVELNVPVTDADFGGQE